MLMETEGGIWVRADATVFRLLMDGGRTERRMQAADRTISAAHRRVASLRRARAMQEHRESVAASRQVERDFAHAWGRSVKIRVRGAVGISETVKPQRRVTSSAISSTSTRAIRAYKAPIRDARGRTAVFFRIRYVGLKSKKWRPGLAAEHALYILREEAQEHGEHSNEAVPILSNMGNTAEEVAACWRALENMEEGYRSNATVQYRIIWNLPNGLKSAKRRELVEDFCERTFGRLGLPWVAAVHEPDARGDQRNYHAHVIFSIRPCEHVGDHQWEIAQEKVNGLTDPDGLRRMRALAAGHMNLACRDAGIAARFTHQTYKERGIDAERQQHIGPKRMAAHECGEAVAVIERNARIAERNEIAAERDATERHVESTELLVELLRKGLDSSVRRAQVAKTAAMIRAIAARARALAPMLAKRATVNRIALKEIATKARALRVALASAPGKRASHVPSLGSPRVVEVAIQRQLQARRTKQAMLDRMSAFRDRLADHHAQKAAADLQRIRMLILVCAAPPYIIRDNKLVPDFSSLAPNDVASIRLVDREELRLALLDRYRLDRQKEEAERSQERAAAEKRQADEMRAKADRQAAVTRLLDLFDRERFILLLDGGRRVVPAQILKRLHLQPPDIANEEWEHGLIAIAKRADSELARIAEYVAGHPEHLKAPGGQWRLDDAAPAEMRKLVNLWAHDPQMRTALGRAAATASATTRVAAPLTLPDGHITAWERARPARQRAMKAGDDRERLDGIESAQPGRKVQRPGSSSERGSPQRCWGARPSGLEFGD